MNKSSTIILAIVAVIIIGAGAVLLFKPATNNTSTTTPSTASPAASPSSPSAAQSAAAKITYSNSGFSPASLTVKSGDTVIITNSSSSDVQMNSNPHPDHTDDTDLNVGLVAAGQSKDFVVTKIGSFGFHNHLNPSQTGKITVQ